MDEEPIKDIPSLKKLQEDVKNFQYLNKLWRFLRPAFKVVGVEIGKIDDAMKQVDDLAAQTVQLTSLPDEFNDLFANRGWIMYSRMNFDLAKRAVELGKSGNFEDAERVLLEYYSPEEVERELKTMRVVDAFRSRMPLAEKALIDLKEGRYYSSVLVILSLLDGMINEIQQRGFFAQDVNLTAWDSIAAHSKGLQKLTEVLTQSRKKTRTERINIPYRHGIMHGMDLGYDNMEVATKSWVALFAARDWAIKAESNELEALPPEPEESWKDLFQKIQDIQNDKADISSWKPRNIIVGTDIPDIGEPSDYMEGSPEQKFVEFLKYWKTRNYGYMARCISVKIGHPISELPALIREEYFGKHLTTWSLREIIDGAPAITVISIQAVYEENEQSCEKLLEARLICEDDDDFGVVRGKPGSRWALVTWYLKEI